MSQILKDLDIVLNPNETLIYAQAKGKNHYNTFGKKVYKDNYKDTYASNPEFLVLTDLRIILVSATISWEQVYDIKVDSVFIYLKLSKHSVDYNPSYNPFTIHPHYIILKRSVKEKVLQT